MKHKKNLKKPVLFLFFILVLAFLISCNQDSIFADIAVEPPPVKPRIAGSSTGIVVLNDRAYMASIGSSVIHTYKNNQWGSLPTGGKIAGLAATSSKLYALVYNGNNRMDASLIEWDGTGWITISKGDAGSYSIQSIYSAGDRLFVGGRSGASWSIFDVNGARLSRIISNAAPLTGAASAGSDYYVSTGGSGIYRVSNPNMAVPGSGGNITGLINVNGTITAVGWDGRILVNSGTGFTTIYDENIHFTGAMAVYKEYSQNQWRDSLLLLGIQTSRSYDKGYREVALVNGAMPMQGIDPVIPGGELVSSVKPENKSKYEASLARYSVHHILQIPNEVDSFPPNPQNWEPLLFASTAGNGIYVLKNGLWNAQE